MTRKEALAELIEKVEAREPILHPLPAWWPTKDWVNCVGAFHGSLDAAKALHEAVLPGWFAGVSENIHGHGWYGWVQTNERHMEARSNQPARAWLLAILKALHAQESGQ